MGVAITLCDQAERERSEDKHDHSFFSRSEAEPLPRLIQIGAPVPLQFLSLFLCLVQLFH
jgi:hypothetical protein